MKKPEGPEFKVKSDYWIGSDVYTITSYGLPVRVTIDAVNVVIDKDNVGRVLGYFSNNYRLLPETVMSEEVKDMSFPGVKDIPKNQ